MRAKQDWSGREQGKVGKSKPDPASAVTMCGAFRRVTNQRLRREERLGGRQARRSSRGRSNSAVWAWIDTWAARGGALGKQSRYRRPGLAPTARTYGAGYWTITPQTPLLQGTLLQQSSATVHVWPYSEQLF